MVGVIFTLKALIILDPFIQIIESFCIRRVTVKLTLFLFPFLASTYPIFNLASSVLASKEIAVCFLIIFLADMLLTTSALELTRFFLLLQEPNTKSTSARIVSFEIIKLFYRSESTYFLFTYCLSPNSSPFLSIKLKAASRSFGISPSKIASLIAFFKSPIM